MHCFISIPRVWVEFPSQSKFQAEHFFPKALNFVFESQSHLGQVEHWQESWLLLTLAFFFVLQSGRKWAVILTSPLFYLCVCDHLHDGGSDFFAVSVCGDVHFPIP